MPPPRRASLEQECLFPFVPNLEVYAIPGRCRCAPFRALTCGACSEGSRLSPGARGTSTPPCFRVVIIVRCVGGQADICSKRPLAARGQSQAAKSTRSVVGGQKQVASSRRPVLRGRSWAVSRRRSRRGPGVCGCGDAARSRRPVAGYPSNAGVAHSASFRRLEVVSPSGALARNILPPTRTRGGPARARLVDRVCLESSACWAQVVRRHVANSRQIGPRGALACRLHRLPAATDLRSRGCVR